MKTACIALDLDRTTLNDKGCLSRENREAIEEALKKGVEIIVASGRALSTLPEDIRKISGIRYAITSNGAAVYEIHTGKCLKQYKMTQESVEKILKLTEKYPVTYEAFVEGIAYAQSEYIEAPMAFGASQKAITYIQSTRKPVPNIVEFIREHAGCLDSIDVVTGDAKLKEMLWMMLENIENIYITSSVAQLLEISHKDSGKHRGAAFLLEYLGIAQEQLAAFGDGDNDAELLRYAGVGIAMANASPKCKAAADMITLSNGEDGVSYGIRKLLESKESVKAAVKKAGK